MAKKKTKKKKSQSTNENAATDLPSYQEFEVLPHWALVAFAVRCARRVQPLFLHAWPDAPYDSIEKINTAIMLGENAAATASRETFESARKLSNLAKKIAQSSNKNEIATNVALTATHSAARDAVDARDAAGTAWEAAQLVLTKDSKQNFLSSILQDFEQLLTLTDEENDKNISIAPVFFGPMWPDGPPEGWPEVDMNTGRSIGEPYTTIQSLHNAISGRVDQLESDLINPDQIHRRIRDQVKGALEQQRTELTKLLDRSTEMANQAERLDKLEKELNSQQSQVRSQLDIAESQIKRLGMTAGTQEARHYWLRRKRRHHLHAKRWQKYVVVAGGSGAAAVIVLFIGLDLLVALDWIASDVLSVWRRLGISAFAATLVFLLLRVMTRIAISHLHLETDAEERVVMLGSYLALLKSNVLVKNEQGDTELRAAIDGEQRDMVLNALFRPSTTGLVNDDAVPASVLDLATRVASGNKQSG